MWMRWTCFAWPCERGVSKAWPHISAQLTQRIPYKRRYNLDRPARPVVSLWGIFSKAASHGGAFSNLRKSIQKPLEIRTVYRQCRVVASPLSTRFASKTSIASSKDNVVDTAMPVPLPTEQLEYDPSINQLFLETSHGSNFLFLL